MTRETTIGLVVSCSFLCLVGVVIVTKMRPGTGPTPHADTLADADVTVVPPAPTPAAPLGPQATAPWGGVGSSSPAAALPGPSMTGAGGGSSGLESLGSQPPPLPLQPIRQEEKEKDLVLTRATSSEPDPKRSGTLDRWGSSGRGTGERAASDIKAPSVPSTKEMEKGLPALPLPAAPVTAGTTGDARPKSDKDRAPGLPPGVTSPATIGGTTGSDKGLPSLPSLPSPATTGTATTGTGGSGLPSMLDLGKEAPKTAAGTTAPPASGFSDKGLPGPLAPPAAAGTTGSKEATPGAAPAASSGGPAVIGTFGADGTLKSTPPSTGGVAGPGLGSPPSLPSLPSGGAAPVTAGTSGGPGTSPNDKKLGEVGLGASGSATGAPQGTATPPRPPSFADFSTTPKDKSAGAVPPPLVPPPPPPPAPGLGSDPAVRLERPMITAPPGSGATGRLDGSPAGVAPASPRGFAPPAGDDMPERAGGARGTAALPPKGEFAQGPPVPPAFGGASGSRPLPPLGSTGTALVPPIAAPLPSASASGAPMVVSWNEDNYKCRPGDTFQSISQTYYQTDKYALALLMFNRKHILAPDSLRQDPPVLQVGQTVYLPETSVLEKQYGSFIKDLTPLQNTTAPPPATGVNTVRSSPIAAEGPATGLPPLPTPGNVASSFQSYVVKTPGGEMIGEIARHTLNTSARWQEIYRLNPGYSAEVKIPAGSILRLPADARVELDNQPR